MNDLVVLSAWLLVLVGLSIAVLLHDDRGNTVKRDEVSIGLASEGSRIVGR